MGFHAPQEAARILGEAIDYARQGQAGGAAFRGPRAGAGRAGKIAVARASYGGGRPSGAPACISAPHSHCTSR